MKNMNNFQDNVLIMLKFGGGGYFKDLNSKSSKNIMYENNECQKKVYDVILAPFLAQLLKICT